MVDLLNSHKNILCYNELFSRSGRTYWGVPGYGAKRYQGIVFKDLKQHDPVAFQRRFVFKRHPREISAVGFKLFYNQSRKGTAEKLWHYLREVEDLKVIHLKRKNLLDVIVSNKIAEESGNWVSRGNQGRTAQDVVNLTHEDCLRNFEKTKQWQQEFDEYFTPEQKMEVIYEDLVADPISVMNDVQELLGVERQSLKASTRKQSSKPVSEIIVDYEQLKASFSGTEWENMFY